MKLQKTPFYQKHIELGGRMVDFGGWLLPVEYKSILLEAKQMRRTCGMFDASHMGQIIIEGQNALTFLQKLTSNNITLIKQGQMQYNLFLNDRAGIIDDFMLYNAGKKFICVINASNKEKVFNWLKSNLVDGVKMSDESETIALISIQGPSSSGLIASVFGNDAANINYMYFLEKEARDSSILISRSGYTGEDGFEIYIPWNEAGKFWNIFLEKGKEFGLIACGLGSRDILRVEAGYPLYGHEIDDRTDPYQALLGWAVKLDKDFIGKQKLLELKESGPLKKRVGFVMKDRAFPRQGYSIYCGSKEIGKVSSGVYSPNKNNFIGMAYVESEHARIGGEINIKVRDKFHKAEIVEYPFVEIRTKRRCCIIAPSPDYTD